jgi:hypothetical protein
MLSDRYGIPSYRLSVFSKTPLLKHFKFGQYNDPDIYDQDLGSQPIVINNLLFIEECNDLEAYHDLAWYKEFNAETYRITIVYLVYTEDFKTEHRIAVNRSETVGEL